jgi:DNA-binding beta-propeller fold protein YncE
MKKSIYVILTSFFVFVAACTDDDGPEPPPENPSAFDEIDELQLSGGVTAAEISAYDPETKKLFIVNAASASIDIIDLSTPSSMVYEKSINIITYGANVNSVHARNGLLAAAIESDPKTNPGKVVIWKTADLSEQASVTVGALPDMVTFSPDGKYIVCANEGESNEDYTIDPKGSVSIIDVQNNYTTTTLDFTSFNASAPSLMENGYRVFGPNADLSEDTEPEYVAISENSDLAYVTLQENNAIAVINLESKMITQIFPLGFKDWSSSGNTLDPSDEDGNVTFGNHPVWGVYLPDAIATFKISGVEYLITANEGDSRLRPTADGIISGQDEGDLYNEESRIKNVDLDVTAFPNAEALQADEVIGRLKITNTLGDIDNDGDFDRLYAFGTRSFSIWNASTGQLVFDSGDKLEKFLIQERPDLYDDDRSDDKGVEPEGVTIGKINGRTLAFVGLERADAVVVVNIDNPSSPEMLQVVETGDAPEGVLFIPYDHSPHSKSLLVVSSEGDGVVKIFEPDGL